MALREYAIPKYSVIHKELLDFLKKELNLSSKAANAIVAYYLSINFENVLRLGREMTED